MDRVHLETVCSFQLDIKSLFVFCFFDTFPQSMRTQQSPLSTVPLLMFFILNVLPEKGIFYISACYYVDLLFT